MKLVELNQEQLNNFASAQKCSQFLQSYEWSVFQESVGQKIFRFGVEADGEIVAVISFIKKNIGAGKSYFYCPRGPLFKSATVSYAARVGVFPDGEMRLKLLKFIFSEIKKIASKENSLFLRFDPVDSLQIGMAAAGKIRKTIDVQPSKTLILDLSKSEDDLLKEMHQKTRYNIRLAEKKGVTIREAGADEFDKFWALMNETVERDGFRLHDKEYYRKMLQNSKLEIDSKFKIQNSKLIIRLYFAEYEGRVIAANIINFFGDMVTYVHGSSSDQDRNVMAPYLLQWEIIKQAKLLGYKHYDFYGIDETKWPGVTRFKKGFGGQEKTYPGTFDVIFNNFSYRIYQTLRWLRRKF